jgi:lysylphosphatidylglycerol synthetase-like protein (DUF2156 family)
MENQPPTPIPRPARWAWTLSLCTAFLWIVVATAYLIRPALSGTHISSLEWVIALLMLGNAVVIVWLGHGLRKGRKSFYYLSLAYLLFNILLTITDDFGTADLIYLVYVGVLFVVLLLSKRKFL